MNSFKVNANGWNSDSLTLKIKIKVINDLVKFQWLVPLLHLEMHAKIRASNTSRYGVNAKTMKFIMFNLENGVISLIFDGIMSLVD